jgi:hypothetical protein
LTREEALEKADAYVNGLLTMKNSKGYEIYNIAVDDRISQALRIAEFLLRGENHCDD